MHATLAAGVLLGCACGTVRPVASSGGVTSAGAGTSSGGVQQAASPAPPEADKAKVTGTVTYLARIALPPTAVVKVQLVDVSRADAKALVLGEQIIETGNRQVPFAFEIAYDPAAIQDNHTYAVSARIEDGGRLLFISDQRYAVVTRGAPNTAELVLTPVGAR